MYAQWKKEKFGLGSRVLSGIFWDYKQNREPSYIESQQQALPGIEQNQRVTGYSSPRLQNGRVSPASNRVPRVPSGGSRSGSRPGSGSRHGSAGSRSARVVTPRSPPPQNERRTPESTGSRHDRSHGERRRSRDSDVASPRPAVVSDTGGNERPASRESASHGLDRDRHSPAAAVGSRSPAAVVESPRGSPVAAESDKPPSSPALREGTPVPAKPLVLDLDAIYRGNFEASVQTNKKALRVFISSVYSDSNAELNYLSKSVYPGLQAFARERGIELNFVDLRLGERPSTTNKHLSQNIALQQIDRCFQESIEAPCFILLAFDKYGKINLPTAIDADEYEHLDLKNRDREEQDLVMTWYRLDNNRIPAQYVLQPLTTQWPEFGNDLSIEAREDVMRQWAEVESRLQATLAQAALASDDLTDQQKLKWQTSALEQQARAVLDRPDGASRSICVRRTIGALAQAEDLLGDDKERIVERYVDCKQGSDSQKTQDMELKEKLYALRNTVIDRGMACFDFSVDWSEDGITEDTHGEYLEQFGKVIQQEVERGIQNAVQGNLNLDRVSREAATHTATCIGSAREFYGREALLNQGLQYVEELAQGEKKGTPLIMHGMRGAGKSSLLSAMTFRASETLERQGKQPVVVVRYCGTSIDSSNGRDLLESMSKQIMKAYGEDDQVPKDFESLSSYFKQQLERATPEKPLLVAIDALFQMSDDDHARSKPDWVPEELPPNVFLIVSTLEEEGDSYQAFRAMDIPPERFLEVEPVRKDEAEEILDGVLAARGRRLEASQRDRLLDMALDSEEERPGLLRLLLLAEVGSTLHAWSDVPDLPKGTPYIIESLLGMLEQMYGEAVVGGMLRFLSASMHGLSETEMLDLLSGDDTIVDSVLQYNETPLRRVPYAILSRIRHSLRSFMVERHMYGRTTLGWVHGRFLEVADKKYLTKEWFFGIKRALMMYFSGTLARDLPMRGIQEHPVFWKSSDQTIFNISRLSEMPNALEHVALEGPEAFSIAMESLCNLEMVAAQCAAGLARNYLSVVERIASSNMMPNYNPRLSDYAAFLREKIEIIEADAGQVMSQATNTPDGYITVPTRDVLKAEEEGLNITPWNES